MDGRVKGPLPPLCRPTRFYTNARKGSTWTCTLTTGNLNSRMSLVARLTSKFGRFHFNFSARSSQGRMFKHLTQIRQYSQDSHGQRFTDHTTIRRDKNIDFREQKELLPGCDITRRVCSPQPTTKTRLEQLRECQHHQCRGRAVCSPQAAQG